ncbi:hypothetical protein ACFQ51_46985 [Streptomyces kaempferi]
MRGEQLAHRRPSSAPCATWSHCWSPAAPPGQGLGASNASAEQNTHFVEELPSRPPL